MKKSFFKLFSAVILASLGLTGCVVTPHQYGVMASQPQVYSNQYEYRTAPAPYYGQVYGDYGTVIAVRMVLSGTTTGVGALGGAVVGGAIGNRFGGGTGKTLSTVAGVLLGASVGNSMEYNGNGGQRYIQEVVVRKNTGQVISVFQPHPQPFHVGDSVSLQYEGGGAVRLFLN